jgi:Flp pilus assembly protein TadG
MKRLIKLLSKNEKGQAAVELALTLPILLLVVCGIIDFGWMMGNKMLLTYCSREGARYGAVAALQPNSVSLITQRVINSAPTYLQSGMTVNVTFSNPADIASGDVTVNVSYNVDALTPITGIFTNGQTVKETSMCVMKIE